MTLGVLALYADGPTTLRHIASWRVKETDRMAAMAARAAQARRRRWKKARTSCASRLQPRPPTGSRPVIHTYDDHRSGDVLLAGGLQPGRACTVRIEDPKCVAKTFPDYFEALFSLSRPRSAHGLIPVITRGRPDRLRQGHAGERSGVAERLGWHYLDSGALYRIAGHWPRGAAD
jgi:3-phosphoshikimate 1-carboxyvinyltransferase